MIPSFCSLTDTKESLQYTIKTYLNGPPMPKFEVNMNYIPPNPPSSMKQCSKSATVKFHMELLLTRSGVTPMVSEWPSACQSQDRFTHLLTRKHTPSTKQKWEKVGGVLKWSISFTKSSWKLCSKCLLQTVTWALKGSTMFYFPTYQPVFTSKEHLVLQL